MRERAAALLAAVLAGTSAAQLLDSAIVVHGLRNALGLPAVRWDGACWSPLFDAIDGQDCIDLEVAPGALAVLRSGEVGGLGAFGPTPLWTALDDAAGTQPPATAAFVDDDEASLIAASVVANLTSQGLLPRTAAAGGSLSLRVRVQRPSAVDFLPTANALAASPSRLAQARGAGMLQLAAATHAVLRSSLLTGVAADAGSAEAALRHDFCARGGSFEVEAVERAITAVAAVLDAAEQVCSDHQEHGTLASTCAAAVLQSDEARAGTAAPSASLCGACWLLRTFPQESRSLLPAVAEVVLVRALLSSSGGCSATADAAAAPVDSVTQGTETVAAAVAVDAAGVPAPVVPRAASTTPIVDVLRALEAVDPAAWPVDAAVAAHLVRLVHELVTPLAERPAVADGGAPAQHAYEVLRPVDAVAVGELLHVVGPGWLDLSLTAMSNDPSLPRVLQAYSPYAQAFVGLGDMVTVDGTAADRYVETVRWLLAPARQETPRSLQSTRALPSAPSHPLVPPPPCRSPRCWSAALLQTPSSLRRSAGSLSTWSPLARTRATCTR